MDLGFLILALLFSFMIAGFIFLTVFGVASMVGFGVSLLLLPLRIIIWVFKNMLWILSSIF
jgi:hypothetical protein